MKNVTALAVSGLLAAGILAGCDANTVSDEESAAKSQFSSLDTDNSSTLSRAEVATSPEIDNAFVEVDENADGQLSEEEFVDWREDNIDDRQYSASEIDEEEVTEETEEATEDDDF